VLRVLRLKFGSLATAAPGLAVRTERGDDSFYLVVSLDRPYDLHVNAAGDIEIPFATRASAERARDGIMLMIRESHPVVAGQVISDASAIEGAALPELTG
jgi:hypothetical protein